MEKIRFTITLSRSAIQSGKSLAGFEKRSFSDMLEVLIERAIRNAVRTVPTENKPLAA
jgi:predicted CopG family antitoxin